MWEEGAWAGSYPDFHEAILAGMPDDQHPNYMVVGAANAAFEQQDPVQRRLNAGGLRAEKGHARCGGLPSGHHRQCA